MRINLKVESILLNTAVFIAALIFYTSVAGILFQLNSLALSEIFLFSIISLLFFANKVSTGHEIEFSKYTFIFLLFLALMAPLLFSPPYNYDEVAYSAALPRDYASAGSFFYNENYGPYSAFPQNYEALTTLSLILFKSLFPIKFLNYVMGFSLAIIAIGISSRMNIHKNIAFLSGCIVFMSTCFLESLPLVKNDLANAYFQCWALFMLILYLQDKKIINVVLSSIFLAISLGMKYNSLLFCFIFVGSFFAITYFMPIKMSEKLKRVAYFLILFLIFSSPWYLKNFYYFGNPFYPALNQYFSSNSFDLNYIHMFKEMFYLDLNQFSLSSGNLLGFIKKFTKEFGLISFILGLSGSFYILLFGSKIAIRDKQILFIAIFSIIYTAFIFLFGFWEARYSISLLILLSATSIFLVNNLYFYFRKYFPYNYSYVFFALFLLIFIKIVNMYGKVEYYYLTTSENSFKKKYVPGWNVADYINKNISPKSKIAVGVGTNQMFYYLNNPYYHIHPLTEKSNLLLMLQQGKLYNLLKHEDIEYLAISSWRLERKANPKTPLINNFYSDINNSVDALEGKGLLQEIKVIDDVIIYKLL